MAYNGDGIITDASNAVTVKTLSVYFDIKGISTTVRAGDLSDITIEVVDENGKRVTDYTGAIRFVSDDTQAVLPDDYTFSSIDAGIHTFTQAVIFNTVGKWYIKVVDIIDENIFSEEFNITVTDRFPPEPVAELTAIPIEGTKIKLEWKKSVSDDVKEYRIYYSTSPDINFNVIRGTVSHPEEAWISPVLGEEVLYYFVVRTVDGSGNEEKNNYTVSAIAESNLNSIVKAIIKIPQNGKKVTGNRLMIMAEIIAGEVSDVKNLLFEYKKDDDTLWQTIPAANSNHPNPDSEYPYFIHWDVNSMEEGIYNIRAVVRDNYDNIDTSPGYISIEIDHSEPDIEEKTNSEGEHERIEKIDNRRNSTVKAGDTNKEKITKVFIPEGAISTDTAKIKVIVNPKNIPEKPRRTLDIGDVKEIKLDGAVLTSTITIYIPYSDKDNNNIIDGTDYPEKLLSPYYYSETKQKWEKIDDISLDTEKNIVEIRTNHFSLFALLAVPAENYNTVRAYPNPFKISKGHTYIKFDNLTVNTKIQIFDLEGKIVWEKDNINAGEVIWDIKNTSGREITSGVYICLITNDLGDKKMIKIAVIK